MEKKGFHRVVLTLWSFLLPTPLHRSLTEPFSNEHHLFVYHHLSVFFLGTTRFPWGPHNVGGSYVMLSGQHCEGLTCSHTSMHAQIVLMYPQSIFILSMQPSTSSSSHCLFVVCILYTAVSSLFNFSKSICYVLQTKRRAKFVW